MSVINKMLRDLDSRQTSATPKNAALNPGRDLARGTSVLMAMASPRKMGSVTFVAVALVVAGLAGGLVVWWRAATTEPTQPMQATSATTVARPAAVMPAVVVGTSPVAVAPRVTVAKPPPLVAAAALAAPVQSPSPTPVAVPALRSANETATPAPPKADIAAKTSPAAANAVVAAAPVLAPTAQRQSAALDALAQAQGLWTAGAREPATELLREAIALTERQGSGASATLVPLARELARMLIAENQNVQALDLLTRLEPALSGQADLWAVRGNAAQRLGRHTEAASAYAMALKMRPGEPRWMLGAAISLAIQGQLVEAGELAEQARTNGALSPELRAYLRQLGVVIRD